VNMAEMATAAMSGLTLICGINPIVVKTIPCTTTPKQSDPSH